MSDPQALAATYGAAFLEERGWSAEEFAALLAAPGAILAGDASSFVLGRVIFDEAEIVTLATHPDYRRQGRARAALDAFHDAARRAGAVTVFLEVAEDNAPARTLYERLGYARTGRRPGYYRRPGQPPAAALILTRPLR